MSKYKVCLEQYHDLAASLLQTGSGEGREDDFFMALERGDVEGIKCILNSIQPLDIKSWVNLKKGDEVRDTPLIITARRGYPELVKLLIQMGADPTLTNALNLTPLHVTKDNCRELILKSAHRSPSKTTALLASSWLGNKYTVQDLLKRGQVDVNTRNLDYFTPLLLVTRDIQIFDKITLDDSVEYEPVQVAAELISYNTNVMKACDDLGRNAVHLAAGHTGPTAQELVELLLNNCQEQELEMKDSRANTPLHYATQSGDREIVACLIRHGANPNAVGDRGYTPLHISAVKGTVELAGFLLGNGADIRIVDDAGDSAYQLASTEGMKRKLKEAWTEATQLERTDSQITITQTCLLEETGARGTEETDGLIDSQQTDGILCYQLNATNRHTGQQGNDNENYNDTSGVAISGLVPTASKGPPRTNRNGYTSESLLAESGVRGSDDDECYLYGEDEEGMDQLRVLPNQLLAGRAMRAAGSSVLDSTTNLLSSQEQIYNQKNQYADYVNNYSTKKKARRNMKRKPMKPPTEDKLKALSMPKYPRGTKEFGVPMTRVSDPTGINQPKRNLAATSQDNVQCVQSNSNMIENIRNKQPESLRHNNKYETSGINTGYNNATGKVKGIHFKLGKESKSTVFDRLHKTPIRNLKPNAKSDVNLLAQIHEEPEVSNPAQESTKPVVVNFGGIKGLAIGAAVVLGNNKDNNPLRFFLLDINQVPEKRRAVNDVAVNKPTIITNTNKQIPTKPINPTSLAVVAQKFSKPVQGLHLNLQTARKPTQSDSTVYNLKTPAEELALLELQRSNTTQVESAMLDADTKPDSPIEYQEDPVEPHSPVGSPSPLSPPPERPPTPLGAAPSHFILPRVSQSPQLVRSRHSSFIENSISQSASLRKSSQDTADTFLPPISPGRSISNPEKHSSLRPRSKSSDCISLSKSLTSINLRSNQGTELDIDDSIFCRCTPQTHRTAVSPLGSAVSPISSRDKGSAVSPLSSRDKGSAVSPISSRDKGSAVSPLSNRDKGSAVSPLSNRDKGSAVSPISSRDKGSAVSPLSNRDKGSAVSPLSNRDKGSAVSPISSRDKGSAVSPLSNRDKGSAVSPLSSRDKGSAVSPLSSRDKGSAVSPLSSRDKGSAVSPLSSRDKGSAVSPLSSRDKGSAVSPLSSRDKGSAVSPLSSRDKGSAVSPLSSRDKGSAVSPLSSRDKGSAVSPLSSRDKGSAVSPLSSRDKGSAVNQCGEDDVIMQAMNSPKMRDISSPIPSLLRTAASRQSIVQKPMLASIELDQISPSRRKSFPSISLSPVDLPHRSIGSLSDNEVPLCPSVPEIEREAVNSEEIVSVLGKSRSRLTNKSCLTPSLPSPLSAPIGELAESDRESDDSEEDTAEVIRWKRGAVLGIGAYGTVVRGLTLDKGMIIAVKQIELNYYDREKAQKQYELVKAEVDVLKRLTHVNIVKYLGSCLDNMTVNIFMEFVAGGSVAKLLKTFGPFEESFLRNYTRQIVTGVKYLHSKTVIHRDVKGDNIMVEPSGCIKLIDFGCARAFRDESSTLSYEKFTMLCKSMKGTVYWMAPEVIREEEYNEKADIWSIGCTVFEMATGKPPWAYKELSQEAALFRIGMGYDIPKLPDSMSDGVKEFIDRCLQQDPSQRPSSKQLLLTPFLKEF